MAQTPEPKESEGVTENAALSNASDHADTSASATDDENYDNVVYRNPADRPVFKLSVQLIDTYKHINKVRPKKCITV